MSTEEQSNFKLPESVSSGIQNVSQNLSQTVGSVKENVSSSLNEFSEQSQAGVGASNQFLQSNTIIAKVVFILLVLIGFLILLTLGTMFLTYITSPPSNPYLIHGMIDGSYPMVVTQDPNQSESVYIQKSNNQSSGIEFTWSFWIYIKDVDGNNYQHIFNKGNLPSSNSSNGIATVNNGPGVYLKNNSSNNSTNTCGLHVIMDTVDEYDINTSIDISNIPIKKWVHVAVRLENTILDVYINGTINSRILLIHVPKQNYDNVNICQNGGFTGNLSNLRYFNYALNVFDINSIVSWGPNLKVIDSTSSQTNYNYLSRNWYSYNQ